MRPLLLIVLLVGCSAPAPSPTPTPEPTAAPTPEPTPAPTPEPRPDAVVDLHVDTITMMMREGVDWRSDSLEASLPKLQQAGINVVVEAAWVERGVKDPFGRALGKLKRIRAMVQREGQHAAIARGPDQLEPILREGRIAVVLALEGGTALTDVASLDALREVGLSVVGLTWSESSPHADSSAEPRRGDAGGLTETGRALVAACNDRGLLLDVSHMSDRATAETVALSRAPVIASHSNRRVLADVPRNLSDELLRAIAAKGGLVGAMFHGPFLTTAGAADRGSVVRQVQGLVEVVGVDHVGLGSDWDGIIQSPKGLETAAQWPGLTADLEAAGLSPEARRGVIGENFVRVWHQAWAQRRSEAPQPPADGPVSAP